MKMKPTTLGELKQTAQAEPQMQRRSVKDELRTNLITKMEDEADIFPGIIGFDETVTPQIVNAILSRHNFILLGLRGQAKSRLLRALTTLLDAEIPVLAGSEVNDNPFAPISKFGRLLLDECGDRNREGPARLYRCAGRRLPGPTHGKRARAEGDRCSRLCAAIGHHGRAAPWPTVARCMNRR